MIYRKFKLFVDKKLLKYSVYKFFLTQGYNHLANLTEVCESHSYHRQCHSKYIRFKDSYGFATDQLPYLLIDIQSNNCLTIEFDRLCRAMRASESFIFWMEKISGLKSNYTVSQYFLHLADSKKNFLIDTFLFEGEDLLPDPHAIAAYFPSKNFSQPNYLLGSTYTYTTRLSVHIHEYIRHLSWLFFNNLDLDLTLRKGIVELYSEGICSKKYLRDLDHYVNETIIFDFFNPREFPSYFSAFEWIAYLVNEKPKFLIDLLQNGAGSCYDASVDTYLGNPSNRQAFVIWLHQQRRLCTNYLNHFSDTDSPFLIYLEDIQSFLNQTQTIESSLLNSTAFAQQEVLPTYLDPINKTDLVPYSNKKTKVENLGFSQTVKRGLPLSLGALFAGFTSSYLDDVGLAYGNHHPSLVCYINYGVKPFLFAMISASLNALLFDETLEIQNKMVQLFMYFTINFLSTLVGRPLAQEFAKRIQNKVLRFFLPMLTWMLLWNPSLFLATERQALSALFLQLIQSLSFTLGEETYRRGKNFLSASSFWHRNSQEQVVTESNALSNVDNNVQAAGFN